MKKKILVVMGGTSKEREISKKSGYACIKALKKLGCKIKIFDPQKKQLNRIIKYRNHIIFNALHGKVVKMELHKVILNFLIFLIRIPELFHQ